jgi:hypothetical protein
MLINPVKNTPFIAKQKPRWFNPDWTAFSVMPKK